MTSIVYVTTNEVSIGCTFSSTEVVISNLQGPQGAPGVVNVTLPLTLDDPTDTIGINSTSGDVASYVVQRDANQRFSIGAIDWDRFSTQSSAEARLYWDGNQSLNLGLGGGNVTIALGQEVINYVTNAEATTLNVGEVVYLFGASGDRPSVKRASNTSDATSAKTFGIVAEAITAGGAGFVVNKGIVQKVNTQVYNPGDILWLGSTPGTFTTTKPVAPNHLVFVGIVLRSNAGNGLVYVSPQNGYELNEIHDVLLTSESDGQFLVYQASNDLWVNKSITATTPVNYSAANRVITIDDASTSAKGAVQLSSLTNSTSEILAATPKAVKDAYDLANTANTTANAAIPATQKGAANGVATLDANSKVPQAQLPAVAITNTYVVASQAAMLALTAEEGDVAIRTDVSKSYILTAVPASTLANWQELLSPPDAVTSVDGRTGTVTLSDLYAARGTTISTTAPLAGGGDLSTNRTLSIADASTTVKGAVQLTDSISSTSTTTAATPNSVKTAYDLANGKPSLSSNNPVALGVAAPGTGTAASKDDHVHPTTGLALLSGGNTFSGSQTATSFIVTGSTVPANGIYLPAANTLGFATNTGVRMQINASGQVGIGVSPATGNTLQVEKSITGAVTARGVYSSGAVQSDVTANAFLIATYGQTQSAIFTLTSLVHYRASGDAVFANVTAGGSVTEQNGFLATSNLSGATNNYGFRGQIVAAANRWNTYMDGTAANYFAGQTTVGSTSLTLGSGSVAQQFGVVAGAATTVGAVIRGAASQTGDLQQWQNSSATVLAKVDASGNLFAPTLQSTTASTATLTTNGNTGGLLISTVADANKGLVIKANSATQSANLFEAQDSSANIITSIIPNSNSSVVMKVGSGAISAANIRTVAQYSGTNANGTYLEIVTAAASGQAGLFLGSDSSPTITQIRHNRGTSGLTGTADSVEILTNSGTTTAAGKFGWWFAPVNATSVPITIKAIANQTANLFEQKTSAGTILGGANALSQIFTGSTAPIFSGVGGAVTGASGDGTTAIVTLTSAPNLAVGDLITVAGINPSGYNATNVLVTAVSNTSPFSVSYANTTTAAWVSGGTVSAPAQASVTARSAGTTGLVVRAAASQSANLTEWQNSSGTILARIDSGGIIRGQYTRLGTNHDSANTIASIRSIVATDTALIVRGAASQTANLQEWQDSAGTIKSYINSSGTIVSLTSSNIFIGDAAANIVFRVRGAASQTANLQEWQNSSSTVLAKVDATGNFVVGNMAIATSSVATIHISNGTIPSANPTGGGVLYVEAGALKYRGSSGTVTTIANA